MHGFAQSVAAFDAIKAVIAVVGVTPAFAAATAGQTFQGGSQQAQNQNQNDQACEHLLHQVPEPRLLPERRCFKLDLLFGCERSVHHRNTVTPGGRIPHGIAYQHGQALQFLFRPGFIADFAGLGIHHFHIINRQGYRQTFYAAKFLADIADGAVHFVVSGRLFTHVHRRRLDVALVIGGCLFRNCRLSGRLVGQGAGDSTGAATGTPLGHLALAAHSLLFGIEQLLSLFHRGEIEISRHFRTETTVAHHRPDHGGNPTSQAILNAGGVIVLVFNLLAVTAVFTTGEQVSTLVDHGHIVLAHFRNAAGNQVHDRGNLLLLQATTGNYFKEHGRCRRARVADKHRALRNRQMNPSGTNRAHAANRSCQLAFQATAETDGFHKLGGSKATVLVQQFVAHGLLVRHALCCKFQAGVIDLIGGHQQCACAWIHTVVDVVGIKNGRDILWVVAGHIPHHRLVIGLLGPENHGNAKGNTGGKPHHQAHLSQQVQPVEAENQVATALAGIVSPRRGHVRG